MTTGERIKAARLKAGFTQTQLANELKIPYQSIGQWERDLRNPKQETLLKIAKILGVHLKDLVDDSIWEEFDKKYPDKGEEVSPFQAVKAYLKELGFSFNVTLLSEPTDGNDDFIVCLSKDGHTATFTENEFAELQAGAKEAIEGRFYKKVLEQENK